MNSNISAGLGSYRGDWLRSLVSGLTEDELDESSVMRVVGHLLLSSVDKQVTSVLQHLLSDLLKREGLPCQPAAVLQHRQWLSQGYLGLLNLPQVCNYICLVMVQANPGYVIYFALAVSRHMQSNNGRQESAECFAVSDYIDYMQKLCSKYQSEVDLALSSILSTT